MKGAKKNFKGLYKNYSRAIKNYIDGSYVPSREFVKRLSLSSSTDLSKKQQKHYAEQMKEYTLLINSIKNYHVKLKKKKKSL